MINIKRLFFVFAFLAGFFLSEEVNAQKFNQFDSNKKRTGVWKKYHPNKRIRYVGQFKNGKEVGVFKFYDITSSENPVILKRFSPNSDSVFVEFFTVKGILKSKGVLIHKKRTGSWLYYFPHGKVLSKENYINGKLDGLLTNYYPDGAVAELSTYKNGLLHGVSKKYSSKKVLIEEIEYRNGKPNGVAKYFELNGALKETGTYRDGKREGQWEYYLDGEIASEKEKQKKATYTKKKGE
ncbi:toxin-antitoxin system YwqK family antitoxin [Polaribacter sp.]|uniref:toxin-antitoxin system YwqK family antitoxin n=1 Tax=Polaribacter sp. TaxID=1920175 RepID=UPI003EF36AC5